MSQGYCQNCGDYRELKECYECGVMICEDCNYGDDGCGCCSEICPNCGRVVDETEYCGYCGEECCEYCLEYDYDKGICFCEDCKYGGEYDE